MRILRQPLQRPTTPLHNWQNKMHAIAMWSGPRNLSTAMMRAWENRPDTQVVDEPFYAYYLAQTQRADPLAKETLDAGTTDWASVVTQLTTPPAEGLIYHKHITTHILAGDSLEWLTQSPGMQHVFLIREPERVVASFTQLFNENDLDELVDHVGFHQQLRVFKHIQAQTGNTPLVIDSTRFLQNPKQHLEKVCHALNIPFVPEMLSWPTGARASDGVWGSHWYKSVNNSTEFGPAPTHIPKLNAQQQEAAMRCQSAYEYLLAFI